MESYEGDRNSGKQIFFYLKINAKLCTMKLLIFALCVLAVILIVTALFTFIWLLVDPGTDEDFKGELDLTEYGDEEEVRI